MGSGSVVRKSWMTEKKQSPFRGTSVRVILRWFKRSSRVVGSGMLMGTDAWYGYGWKFKSSILFGVSEISRCEKELLEN